MTSHSRQLTVTEYLLPTVNIIVLDCYMYFNLTKKILVSLAGFNTILDNLAVAYFWATLYMKLTLLKV